MARVGLVSLYVVESNGIRYLASALRGAGISTDECYVGQHLHHAPPRFDPQVAAQLVEHFRSRDVGLVGISVRIGALVALSAQLTRTLKQELGVPVVWGGPHVSMAPEECIPHTDYLVLGEGEAALCELARNLLDGKPSGDIRNVWSNTDGDIRRNPLRPLVEDIDSFPFPDFHSNEDKFWFLDGRVTTGDPLSREPCYRLMATRGCVKNCGFCGVSAFRRLYKGGGRFYRVRSVENTLAEIEHARTVRPSIRYIRFDDELFALQRDWIEEFCRGYRQRVGLPFNILSSPQVLDDSTIDILAEAGLDLVYLGVQTTSAANRERYDRLVPDDDVRRCVSRLQARGVRPSIQILIDDPDTGEAEKAELLELLLSLPRPFDLHIYSLCHWPGTTRTLQLLASGTVLPADVEGANSKALHQFNADFTHPRPPGDTLLLALYMLSNKSGFPRALVRRMAASRYLHDHPAMAVATARAVNAGKLVARGTTALVRGELSLLQLKQWMAGWRSGALPSI